MEPQPGLFAVSEPLAYAASAAEFKALMGLRAERPSLEALERLLSIFTRLPYENLSKILKYRQQRSEAIRLPDEVVEDHARHGLGGTCFSLTFFLLSLLAQSGYTAYPVLADMRYGPNTHCAAVLLWEGGKFLIDPGYLLTRPLAVRPDRPSVLTTAVSTVELLFDPTDERYHLYTIQNDERKWRYVWTDAPTPMEDFFRHWRDSFHWSGMRGLCLNKVADDRMVYVHKRYLRETSLSGKKSLMIKDQYHVTIERFFGIRQETVEAALAAVAENLALDRASGLWIPKHKEASHAAPGR